MRLPAYSHVKDKNKLTFGFDLISDFLDANELRNDEKPPPEIDDGLNKDKDM